MTFRITGLDPTPFQPLYGLSDEALAEHRAVRRRADESPGFPERVEMRDAEVGETLLLVNHVHQPAETPYHASHAVFIREGATTPYDRVGEVPMVLSRRLISLRGFGEDGMIVDADLAEGAAIEGAIERLLANGGIDYIQAHYAKFGCFAAQITRA